jgi:hypothetical protein
MYSRRVCNCGIRPLLYLVTGTAGRQAGNLEINYQQGIVSGHFSAVGRISLIKQETKE